MKHARRLKNFIYLFLLAVFSFTSPCMAQSLPTQIQTPEATVSLISKTRDYSPNTPLELGIHFQLEPGWHIYALHPGDAGLPTEVLWEGGENTTFSTLTYPPHKTFNEGGLSTNGYDTTALFTAQATSKTAHGPLNLTADVSWLACKEICIPGKARLGLSLPVATDGNTTPSWDALTFPAAPTEPSLASTSAAPTSITASVAFALAIIGGLILNLMPCVFPVLALKIFQFTEMSNAARATVRRHSLIYVAGALTGFAMIGGVLVAFSAGGNALGWGYQLQSPSIVLLLALIMLWVGVEMADILPASGTLASLTSRLPIGQSPFFTGLLAVAVASPCTAPFMGGAIGFAALQTPVVAFGIIMGVGVGFALPFAMLAWIPGLIRYLPRPGNWMMVLKKILSVPMFIAAAWLLWVLSHQINNDAIISVCVLLILITIISTSKLRRHNLVLVGVAVFSTLWFVGKSPSTADNSMEHHEFTQKRLAELQMDGRPVLVDFTADWCITCKVNEATTLNSETAKNAFKSYNVARLTADWTRRDEKIKRALTNLGRNGVPVYALYTPGEKKPVLLPEILTPSILEEALSENLKQDYTRPKPQVAAE